MVNNKLKCELQNIYNDFKEQLRYAENKNNILVTITGVIFIPIFTVFSSEKLLKKFFSSSSIKAFWIMSMVVGVSVLVIFALSCFPISNSKFSQKFTIKFNSDKYSEFNILFYKWWLKDLDICKNKIFIAYDSTTNNNTLALIIQVHEYAFIVNRKYFFSKLIIYFFISFIFLFFISTLLIFFK